MSSTRPARENRRKELSLLLLFSALLVAALTPCAADASLPRTNPGAAALAAEPIDSGRFLTANPETPFWLLAGDELEKALTCDRAAPPDALILAERPFLDSPRLTSRACEAAFSLHMEPVDFGPNLQRGPPLAMPDLHQGWFVAEPKTRIGGFRLELEDLIGGERRLSLELQRGYLVGRPGHAEGEPQDPGGLAGIPMRQRKGARGENALVADLLAQGWIIFWGGSKGAGAHPVTGHGPDVFAFHAETDTLAFFDDKNWEKDLVSRVNNLENLEKSKFMDRARDAVLDSELPATTKNKLWNRLNVGSYVPGVTQYRKLVSGAASEADVERVGPRLKSAGVEFFDVSRKGRVLYGSKVKRMFKRIPYIRLAIIGATFLTADDKVEAALEAVDPTGFLGDEKVVTTEQEQVGMILDLQRAEHGGNSEKRMSVMTADEWRELIRKHSEVRKQGDR